jgi:serine/threonine-protein kinase
MNRILHYDIARQLGEGKNGVAYAAMDSGLQRAVVVKMLERTALSDERNARFVDLMEKLNELDDVWIARFYSLEEADGKRFVVREYVEGHSAAELVRKGPVGYARWLEIALDVARIIRKIHDSGLVHGNVTAGNVLIDGSGKVHLLDAGLGQTTANRSDQPDTIYLAPEILQGSPVSASGDLYALGVTLYILLTGRSLEYGDASGKPRSRAGCALPVFAEFSEAEVPGVARLLISRLLAPDASDRLGSADELILTLQGMMSLGAELPVETESKRSSPTPRQYLMVSVLFVLLVILWLVITSQPK